jgi:hypothetical protein
MRRYRVLSLEPPSEIGSEPKITEEIVETSPAWTIKDLKSNLENYKARYIRDMFASGKRLDGESLTVSLPVRTLSWTPREVGFHVVEVASLQTLFDRGEGYRLNPVLKSLKDVNSTCFKGSKAMRASSGSGGVYFLKSSVSTNGQILACFKPRDDEPGSRNNPNHHSIRDGVLPGEAAEREVAAFILDWGGFCGVPATVLVEAACENFGHHESDLYPNRPPKIGSFQHFVQNAPDTVGDFSPHLFSPREVHKIGILDLRFLNMDRNDSNILVLKRNDEYRLVPIDHGLCFPDRIEVGWCDWVWWDWPQTLVPFDQETREWVMSLDVMEDLQVLERCFALRPECIRIYRCMTMLLQKGVAAGLNLRDIASVVVRSHDIDEPSAMEKTIQRASELALLMETNSRIRAGSELETGGGSGRRLHRSSSFDGNISCLFTNSSNSSLNGVGSKVSDELFFSYVDRLLEDVVAEILQKKSDSFGDRSNFDGSWFSASTRSSPSELTKIASPRLFSNGLNGSSRNRTFQEGVRQRVPSIPALSLQQ